MPWQVIAGTTGAELVETTCRGVRLDGGWVRRMPPSRLTVGAFEKKVFGDVSW